MMADQSFVLTVAVLMALLMVSRIPMFSLKLKDLGWQNNKVRYIFLVCCVISIVAFQAVGLLLIIPLYILLSVIIYLFFKKQNEIQS
jgi:CDP-diacylglycerol--serine O-phosphatidyltransferase